MELRLPGPGGEALARLCEGLDADRDGALEEGEFLELFSLALRQVTFDGSARRLRGACVGKRQGCVWDVYERLQEMGTGTFGKAFLCRHKGMQEERAVKVVKKVRSRVSEKDTEREVAMLRRLDHPHVVRFFEWYEDPQRIYLVMEALQGGTLQATLLDLQRKNLALREEWSRKVMRQVIEAMAYCHSLRVIHKDLKDENIMLLHRDLTFQNPFAVIIDLGAAETFSMQSSSHAGQTAVAGTPATMAPEVWSDQVGPKCDVWSAGCILFELLAGRLPFISHGQRPEAWLALHRRGPDWSSIRTSSAGRDLCVAMLRFHDSKRPAMAECLSHRWFAAQPRDLGAVSPSLFAPLLEFCRGADDRRSLLFDMAARLPMRRAQRIAEAFKSFDADGNGSVSPEEFRTGLVRAGLDDEALAQRMFAVLDADQDGALSFTEFSAGVLLACRDLIDERFRALFREHHGDGDDALSLEEAERLLSAALPPELGAKPGRLLAGLSEKPGGRVRYAEIHERLFGAPPPARAGA